MRKTCVKPVNALRITWWIIRRIIPIPLASRHTSGITHISLHRKNTVTTHSLHTIIRQYNRQLNVFMHSMHIAYIFNNNLNKRILINK